MTANQPCFGLWLVQQADRDDDIGSLAKSAQLDSEWSDSFDPATAHEHIEEMWQADPEVIAWFRIAVGQYYAEFGLPIPETRERMTETQRQNAEVVIAAHVAGEMIHTPEQFNAIPQIAAEIAKKTVEALDS